MSRIVVDVERRRIHGQPPLPAGSFGAGEREEQLTDPTVGHGRVAHRPVRIDSIAVPCTDPFANEITLITEVGQHAVGVTIRESDPTGDLAHRQIRVPCNRDQHGPMGADERPVTLSGHLG